jgi:hypothetical protein
MKSLVLSNRPGHGNFEKKIARLIAEGKIRPDQLNYVDISHDNECAMINDRGDCNCDPEIKFMSVKRPNVG